MCQDISTHRGEPIAPMNLADPRPQLHSLVCGSSSKQLFIVVHAQYISLMSGEEAIIVEDNAITVPVKAYCPPDHYHIVRAENIFVVFTNMVCSCRLI